jgi:hypothetical protein
LKIMYNRGMPIQIFPPQNDNADFVQIEVEEKKKTQA